MSAPPAPPAGDEDDSQNRQMAFDACAEHVVRLRQAGTPDEKIFDMLMKGRVVTQWASQLVKGCEQMLRDKA